MSMQDQIKLKSWRVVKNLNKEERELMLFEERDLREKQFFDNPNFHFQLKMSVQSEVNDADNKNLR